jgi:hypothetical protein
MQPWQYEPMEWAYNIGEYIILVVLVFSSLIGWPHDVQVRMLLGVMTISSMSVRWSQLIMYEASWCALWIATTWRCAVQTSTAGITISTFARQCLQVTSCRWHTWSEPVTILQLKIIRWTTSLVFCIVALFACTFYFPYWGVWGWWRGDACALIFIFENLGRLLWEVGSTATVYSDGSSLLMFICWLYVYADGPSSSI